MAKGCAISTGYLPRGGLPRNSVDRITDCSDMTSGDEKTFADIICLFLHKNVGAH